MFFVFFSLKFVILGKKMGEQEQRERGKVRVRAGGGGAKEAEGSYYLFIHCQFNCIICITVTNKYFLLPFCISALIFFLLLYLNYQAEMTKFCYILCEIDNIFKTSPN